MPAHLSALLFADCHCRGFTLILALPSHCRYAQKVQIVKDKWANFYDPEGPLFQLFAPANQTYFPLYVGDSGKEVRLVDGLLLFVN